MKVNFSQAIKDLDGKSMLEPTGEKDKDGKEVVVESTLKMFAVRALTAMFKDEENLDGEKKFKRMMLAQKIYKSEGEIGVSPEDISLLKKLIGKGWGPMVVWACYNILDPQ